MLYAILCYNAEPTVQTWSKEQDDAVMARLGAVKARWTEQGRLGPSARLMPTTAATTVRKGKDALVLDGPFAETKESLLGFYIVDCASLDQAIECARDLAEVSGPHGSYEIRPLRLYHPGVLGA